MVFLDTTSNRNDDDCGSRRLGQTTLSPSRWSLSRWITFAGKQLEDGRNAGPTTTTSSGPPILIVTSLSVASEGFKLQLILMIPTVTSSCTSVYLKNTVRKDKNVMRIRPYPAQETDGLKSSVTVFFSKGMCRTRDFKLRQECRSCQLVPIYG